MKKKTRKYLLYAVGEMVLVVVGILIALQIDNWNTDRQQQAMLESYLQSIASNMREDASELELLRSARSARIFDATRSNMLVGRIGYSYTVAEIFFFNKLAEEASQNLFFNSDTGGYEALKRSGVIGRLQDSGVERLLSKYYDQVRHIEALERRLNELLNSLKLQFVLSYPTNVTQWNFWAPRAIPPDQFQQMQPQFAAIINGPAVREMINLQIEASVIILEYDRLLQLGDAFVSMIESNRLLFNDAESETLLGSDVLQPDRYAEVVVNGDLAAQYYNITGVADGFSAIFDYRFISRTDDYLRISYPGSDSWAAVFLQVMGVDDDRPVLDFSRFDKLVLELKADTRNTALTVHIKDRFMPDTVAPDSVELQLTDEWQTYEIDLERFERTDPANLITPLGFNFLKEPQSFLLRNARYVNAD